MAANELSSSGKPMLCVLDKFTEDGTVEFGPIFDKERCESLLVEIRRQRAFGPNLFLSESDFLENPQHTNVNPRPGHNMLVRFEDKLGFLEAHPTIVASLNQILGVDYQIFDKKIVCGIPESWLPSWLVQRIAGNPVNNLGAYVKPDYRDVTYFYGIDFHQDIIDWKGRHADFITLYVYLHPVTEKDAPLYILPGSHHLGATNFPHELEQISRTPNIWRYDSGRGDSITCRQRMLVGDTGYAALWHSCVLHGTQPDVADHERISLRYLIGKKEGAGRAGIDAVNETLRGVLSLDDTRSDLAADGSARIKKNAINLLRETD